MNIRIQIKPLPAVEEELDLSTVEGTDKYAPASSLSQTGARPKELYEVVTPRTRHRAHIVYHLDYTLDYLAEGEVDIRPAKGATARLVRSRHKTAKHRLVGSHGVRVSAEDENRAALRYTLSRVELEGAE